MTEALSLGTSFSASYVSTVALALVRVLGALSVNPLLGSPRIPLPARVGLGFFLTLALFPPGRPLGPPLAVGPLEILGELFIGLLAGFAVTVVFAAVQLAASLVGTNSGLSMASTLDPSADLGTGSVERFFSAFALVVFVQINGHHLFIAGLRELFVAVEVGGALSLPQTPEALAAVTAMTFAAAVKMVLPVVAALLLTDLGFAILARVAPQLNLFALGVPAKVGVGLVMLVVAMPWILPRMSSLFRGVPETMRMLVG